MQHPVDYVKIKLPQRRSLKNPGVPGGCIGGDHDIRKYAPSLVKIKSQHVRGVILSKIVQVELFDSPVVYETDGYLTWFSYVL